MKNFSKNKLRWTLTLGATALMCFVLGLCMTFGYNVSNLKANAEGETSATLEIAYDYVKYPTLAKLGKEMGITFTDTSDILVGATYAGTYADGSAVNVTITAPNVTKVEEVVSQTADVNVATSTSLVSGWKTAGYESANGYVAAICDDNTNNSNTYDGNLSVYSSANAGSGVNFVGDKSFKYGLLQMRTKYRSGNNYALGLLRSGTHYKHKADYNAGGYLFYFSPANGWVRLYYYTSSDGSGTNAKTQVATKSISGLTNGNSYIITYGVYPQTTESGNTLHFVFRIQNDESDVAIVELATEHNDLSNSIGVSYSTNANCFSFGCWKGSSITSYTVEGVDKPLFSEWYEEVELSDGYVGDTIDSVNIEKDGWSYADSTQILKFGENSVKVNVPYYNGSYERALTINGLYKETTEVTVSYNDYIGKTLKDIKLDNGIIFNNEELNKEIIVGAQNIEGVNSNGVPVGITLTVTAPTAKGIETIVGSTSDVIVTRSNQLIGATKTEGGANLRLSTATNGNGAGWIFTESSKYGLIQVRTAVSTATGMQYHFGLLRSSSEKRVNPYYELGGYYLTFDAQGQAYIGKWIEENSVVSKERLKIIYDAKLAENGTTAVVTYGIYPEVVDGVVGKTVYFKAESNNVTLFELKVYDTESVYAPNNGELFTFGANNQTSEQNVTLEGVNKPLFDVESTLSVDTECLEGNALSTVDLGEGYQWKNPDELISTKTTYDAWKSFEYYGKTAQSTVKVELSNIKSLSRTTALFYVGENKVGELSKLNSDGGEIDFSAVEFETSEVAIGWLLGDKLYPLDYKLPVGTEEQTLVYKLATVDFKVNGGASIRTTVDENGEGGIRFITMIDGQDATDFDSYIKGIYGAIVPNESAYIADGVLTDAARNVWYKESYNLKNAVAKTASQVDLEGENYNFYTVVLSSILYENYNREFAGCAFLEVSYEGGTAFVQADFDNTHVSSIYDVALEFIGQYPDDIPATVKNYVANVIELSEENGVYTQDDLNDAIAVEDRPYKITGATVNKGVLTLNVTMENADSIILKNSKAPITINHIDGTTYTKVRYVGDVVANGTEVTITVTLGN